MSPAKSRIANFGLCTTTATISDANLNCKETSPYIDREMSPAFLVPYPRSILR
jgi:hypothetical protein